MILTYKYRIKDNRARKALTAHAYGVNQVWNYCVSHQRETESRYRAGLSPKWTSNFGLQRLTAGSSKLLGIHAQTVGEVCRFFAEARERKCRSPKYRASQGGRRALGWVPFRPRCKKVDGNSVRYLGKRYRFWDGGRPVPPNAKGGCFVEDARGRWYVCFFVEVETDLTCGEKTVGIDLGLNSLAALSDGTKGRVTSDILSEREGAKDIAARAGHKKRTRAIHAKIRNCRRDYIHKATSSIVRQFRFIALGDIKAQHLAMSPMSKSVMDIGWGMFRKQLAYKARRHRAAFHVVSERLTSRTCS